MKNSRPILVTLLAICLGPAVAAPVKPDKGHYGVIEVNRFDVEEGVDFPTDYLLTLTEDLVQQLQETRKFKEVIREGESPVSADLPVLRLVGTVTKFQKGSRAKRYFVGFGAGKTKVVARVQWVDAASSEVVAEDDVDGKVILGGLVKGESIGATRGLAKEVAKKTRKLFF